MKDKSDTPRGFLEKDREFRNRKKKRRTPTDETPERELKLEPYKRPPANHRLYEASDDDDIAQ